MKHSAITSSICKFIFFLIISFFGVTASAYQQCQEITVYGSGGCSSGGSGGVCVSGSKTTQKVCYEVPDGAGPIPGGPAPGLPPGPDTSGGGGERPEPPKRPKPAYCNTIELDKAKCQENAQTTYRNESSSCSNWTYGGGVLGLGVAVAGAYFTGGATLIVYLGAGATGGLTGLGGGSALSNSCDSDKQKARDSDIAACETKSKATALDCSTY